MHALGQCRNIIRKLGIKAVVAADTAGAAREVAEAGDITRAALATTLAAKIYGLKILQTRRCRRQAQHHALRRAVAQAEMGEAAATAGRDDVSCSRCATFPPRSTRRSAASPPTAST